MVSNDVLFELICAASDITGTIFLFILVIRGLFHIAGDDNGYRASAVNGIIGAVLLIAGINCHLLGEVSGRFGTAVDDVFYMLAFILIFLSIDRFFLGIVEVSGHKVPYRIKSVINILAISIGISAYLANGYQPCMTIVTFIELIAGTIYCMKMNSAPVNKGTIPAATAVPAACMIVYFVYPQIRVIGLGLAVMFFIEHHSLDMLRSGAVGETQRAPESAGASACLLSNQITAHFVFNALQVIEKLCREDPDKAAAALNAFSQYLRANLENLTSAELIPFARELEYTRKYVELVQMVKGQDTANIEYRLGVTDFEIPALTLQPLVENAIVHGTGAGGCDIVITTEEATGTVVIKVENGYRSSTSETDYAETNNRDTGKRSDISAQNTSGLGSNQHRSIGLENTRARLAKICRETLELRSENERTLAIIRIPR